MENCATAAAWPLLGDTDISADLFSAWAGGPSSGDAGAALEDEICWTSGTFNGDAGPAIPLAFAADWFGG